MDCLKTWRDCADPTGYSIREFYSKEQKWWYRPIEGVPLSDDEIQKHLKRGDDARAIWLNVGTESNPESRDHTRLMVFDFDDHNERILVGSQPPELTLEKIIRKPIPLDWDVRARIYGFSRDLNHP